LLATANQSVTDLTADRDGLTAQLALVITSDVHNVVVVQRDQLLTRVTELEQTAKTAGQQAADIVSNVAVPPVSAESAGANDNRTVAEIRSEFDAEINSAKRKKLWAELSAAMNR